MKKILIGGAWPYANGSLHIGHIAGLLPGDVLARYHRARDMNYFLKVNARIGIFAEGTTRRPEGCDFGIFDESFILLAKRNKAVIQPVTVTWIKDKEIKNKIVVNFGKSFAVESMSTEEAMEKFMEIQRQGLRENEGWIERQEDKGQSGYW